MTTSWGPGIDAEVGYRQQRVRADYHRKLGQRKFGHRKFGYSAARSKPRSIPRRDTSTTFAMPLITARV